MRLPLARDPNRRTVQRRTGCLAASARVGRASTAPTNSNNHTYQAYSCLAFARIHRASLRSANAADRRTIRHEAAPRPETYELAAAVVRTLELRPVTWCS